MLLPAEYIPSRRLFTQISIVLALPIVGALVLHALSLDIFVRLGLLGAVAAAGSMLILAYPMAGLLSGLFYIYAGLSIYFRFHLGYPIIVLAMLSSLLEILRGQKIRLDSVLFNFGALFFTVFAIQSMLFAYEIHYCLENFSAYLKVLIIVFLIVQLARSIRDLEWILGTVFVGAISSVVLGVVNLKLGIATDINVLGYVNILRFEGTVGDPNVLALILLSVVPIGVYLSKRSPNAAWKLFWFLGLAVVLVAAFTTFSRMAIFPFLFIFLAVLIREARRNKAALVTFLVTVVAALILLIPSFYWARLGSIMSLASYEGMEWSLYLRMKAVRTALQLVAEHPLTGVGLRNFLVRSAPDMFARIVVHNLYLEVLVGVGFFGFVSLMAVYFSGLKECVSTMRSSWSASRAYVADLAYYLLVSIVCSLIAGMFLSMEFYYFLWVPLGCALALGRMARDRAFEASTRGAV